MDLQVAAHQVEGYRVQTAVYDGPLDLLLQLIERADLNITTLALAQVTDQYLAHLRQMEEQDAAEVSGFLVIAARLLQIKSAALLPHQSIEQAPVEEEDSGEALARQLILYKRFKELAAGLGKRQEDGLRTYLRVAPPPIKAEAKLDLSGVTLQDLVYARAKFLQQPDLPALSGCFHAAYNHPREDPRHHRLIARVEKRSVLLLHQEQGDRLEIVVTFLAMLELIKRRVVSASQSEMFGEIAVSATGEWNEEEDSQLEFIE